MKLMRQGLSNSHHRCFVRIRKLGGGGGGGILSVEIKIYYSQQNFLTSFQEVPIRSVARIKRRYSATEESLEHMKLSLPYCLVRGKQSTVRSYINNA